MIHPLMTILFDVFLIGSTLTIIAGIAVDTYTRRGPSVGAAAPRRASTAGRRRAHSLAVRRLPSHRRGVMVRG